MKGSGKGWHLDAYELWSLSIFLLGTLGILLGGLAVDYVHNKAVFTRRKRKKTKKKKHERKGNPPKKDTDDNKEEEEYQHSNHHHSLGHEHGHKPSIAENSSAAGEDGDNANAHSFGNNVTDGRSSGHLIPIKAPQSMHSANISIS